MSKPEHTWWVRADCAFGDAMIETIVTRVAAPWLGTDEALRSYCAKALVGRLRERPYAPTYPEVDRVVTAVVLEVELDSGPW